jgi:spore coat polysaccharide biosynthesis protein SpsF
MRIENLRVFIQARMSSSRFPGKSLAPLAGKPLLAHVVSNVSTVVGLKQVVVLTSVEASDDPLAAYAERCLGVATHRGDLQNVVLRFQRGLEMYPCEWFVRVCGDSPLIEPALINAMITRVRPEDDLVTNVATRTFPPGQSVEILKSSTFLSIDTNGLSPAEKEHVTAHYYSRPDRYTINALRSAKPELARQPMVVDTVKDLDVLEARLATEGLEQLSFSVLVE